MTRTPKSGHYSPWGAIQHATEIAPGIVSVSTASHGGIWLSPERYARVPASLQAVARQYADAPWFEEDCDVTIVGAIFAEDLRAIEPQFVAYCEQRIKTDTYFRKHGYTPES